MAEIRSLASGVRFVVVALTLMIAAFNLRLSFQIDIYRRLFQDALPGKPLPTLTNIVIYGQIPWILVAIVLPILAILIAFSVRNNHRALVGLSVIMILAFIQANLAATAFLSPMFDLMCWPSVIK